MKTFSIAENETGGGYPSATLATHTFSITSKEFTNASGTTTVTVTPPTSIGVKYNTNNSGRTGVDDRVRFNVYAGSTSLGYAIYAVAQPMKLAANTNGTLPLSTSTLSAKGLNALFSTSNPTVRSIPITWTVDSSRGLATGIWRSDGMKIVGYRDALPATSVTEGSIKLNAPPTFDSTQVYYDTPYVYAGYTTASVDVSNVSVKYGGNLSSIAFTIGGQTVTGSGTLSIPLAESGVFTPKVTVTDSRGQVTTKTLNAITVDAYVPPSASFLVERTNSLGAPNDEGENAVITASFNWTEDIATLSVPTIAVTDPNNLPVSVTATWYSARENDGTFDSQNIISDWSEVEEGQSVYCLLSGNNPFDTQYSYQIALTPNDSEGSGTTIFQVLGGAFYTVDFLAGGHGVAFGMPATDEGFHCGMDAHFYNIEGNDGVVSVHLKPRDAYDWNTDHAPANNAYGTGFEIYDSANHRIANLDAHAYPNGDIATVLGVHRLVNDSHVYHQIFLYIDADGTTRYSVNNAAAFRKAIGLDVTTATCTPASGWAHYSDADTLRVQKMGNVVTFCGALKNTSQISCNSAGNSSFQMTTIPSGYRPSQNATFLCQGSGAAVWLCRVYTNGTVYMERYRLVLQTTNPVTITAGTWFPILATWIMV